MSVDGKDLSTLSMLELFRMETENHCAAFVDALLLLEERPEDQETLAALMRAAHSIKGAARLVHLDPLVRLTHAMEEVFNVAQQGSLILSSSDIDILLSGVDLLGEIAALSDEQVADWLARKGQKIEGLVTSFEQLSQGMRGDDTGDRREEDAGQEPLGLCSPSLDDGQGEELQALSMLDLFRQELEGHIQVLGDNILALEDGSCTAEVLDALMRAAHSIKGAARIMNFGPLVALTHAMEDFFVAAQGKKAPVARENIDALLQGTDLLAELIRQADGALEGWLAGQEPIFKQLIDQYRAFTQGKNEVLTGSDDGEREGDAVAVPERGKVVAAGKTALPEGKESRKKDSPEQSLRVSAEGLNRLMGLAGEVQVESHWLPTYILKLLRLKQEQDRVYRLLNRQYGILHSGTMSREQHLDGIQKMIREMEGCRKQLNGALVEIEDHARRATEISYHLHQEVIANRMRPLADWLHGFPRMVRDLARELGKEIKLEIVGADTLVDRDVLDKIESPLNHLIRNAVDHGVETPRERKDAGKPERATVVIEARHCAGMLQIVVRDDGRGIELEKLRARVIARKMISEEMARALSENELLDFLFLPNFTTRDEVSTISGRGVGLDVVHSAIHEVRGSIRILTGAGEGTSFELQLPLTLSVTRSLLVTICEEDYAFPLVAVDHVLKLSEEDIKEVEGRQYVTYDKERIGLISARQVLEKKNESTVHEGSFPVLIISDRHNRYGLIVDSFIGIRDLVVHSLDRRLQKIQDINAAAILDDGTPVLIVDVEDMVRSIDHLISGNRVQRIDRESLTVGRQMKRVLVVDDSITVREVERKMLATRGYEVEVAIDGQDGWNSLRNSPFDLVISDVDMPRMDGIELVTLIREDERFRLLPIIIVSYKDREEDRLRGLDAGADYYLTKGSFQDETLVQAVVDLIGEPDEH